MLIGDPINFDDILEFDMEKGSNVPRRRLFDAVASRIGDRLHEMKVYICLSAFIACFSLCSDWVKDIIYLCHDT